MPTARQPSSRAAPLELELPGVPIVTPSPRTARLIKEEDDRARAEVRAAAEADPGLVTSTQVAIELQIRDKLAAEASSAAAAPEEVKEEPEAGGDVEDDVPMTSPGEAGEGIADVPSPAGFTEGAAGAEGDVPTDTEGFDEPEGEDVVREVAGRQQGERVSIYMREPPEELSPYHAECPEGWKKIPLELACPHGGKCHRRDVGALDAGVVQLLLDGGG
jgi:hypothetical protein